MSIDDDQPALDPERFWPDGQPRVSFPVSFDPAWRQRGEAGARRSEGSSEGSEVGYGRPPKEHQFQPGQSGNPNGRPPGSRNRRSREWGDRLRGVVLQEVFRELPVRDGDGPATIPLVQAVMRAAAARAVKGHVAAQRLVLDCAREAEADEMRVRFEEFEAAHAYKVHAREEIAWRRGRGNTDHADIVPHPDDVVLDLDAGEVRLIGPKTAKERDAFHQALMSREVLLGGREHASGLLKRARTPERRALIQGVIGYITTELEALRTVMPDWVDRRPPTDLRGDPRDLLAASLPRADLS